jgi:aspartate/methionine/tyrosine aminotransferase
MAESRSDSDVRLAARMDRIEPFRVMEVQRRAFQLEREGRHVVHMEIGQPDFPAPQPVIDAAVAALRRDPMGYTAALGVAALREALARFYSIHYGVEVSPARIIITAGASGAFMIAMGALIDPGDEVLMPDPGYPCNRNFVRMFEGIAKTIPVEAATGYQLTLEDVCKHWGPRTRGVMLASPANPTGSVVPAQALKAISEEIAERGGFLLVDEIYHALTYEQETLPTALALSDRLLVVNSFSKYFCMTGWRLGWLVAPEAFIGTMERFAQNAFICVSAPAQHAALAAFYPETLAILEARRAEFRRRRDFLIPALREIGFRIPLTPEGAFYVYADCARFSQDSEAFALQLLEKVGVAITPGTDFGSHRAGTHVRFAYTRALDDLAQGVERLARFLNPAKAGIGTKAHTPS